MTENTKEYHYSEIFDSIQGEGHYTGYPTAWLRFFLCNLQCDGFGQKDPTDPSTYILPYKDFNTKSIQKLEDLPVWEYGCDSSYSWSKKYKHLQHKGKPYEIAERIRDSFINEFNNGKWLERHLCFTGGEPMMKHAQDCSRLIMQYYVNRHDYPKYVTYETNGTQPMTKEFIEFYREYIDVFGGELFFSVSPKLWSVAGEEASRAIKPEIVGAYNDEFFFGQLKFVVNGTNQAWDELEQAVEKFRFYGVDWPVWIMPVGATVEGQKLVDGDVAREAYRRGYRVSARVHAYLWGNVIGV